MDFKSLAQIFGGDQFYTNMQKEEGDIWTNLTIPDTLFGMKVNPTILIQKPFDHPEFLD